jgi:hypothetical protein
MLNKIQIYKIEDIDLDKIIYMNADLSSDVKIIHLQYIDNNGRYPLLIQIDNLYMIDDIQKVSNKKCITHEVILPLVGKNAKSSEKVKNFFESIDKKIICDAKNYVNIWPFDTKNIKYKALIRYVDGVNNRMYDNGVIKLKFIRSKNFKTRIYNKKKTPVEESQYTEIFNGSCYVKSIVEIVSVWIKNGIFGLYVRPHQLKVSVGFPPIFTPKYYSFDDGTESNDDDFIYDTEVTSQSSTEEKENEDIAKTTEMSNAYKLIKDGFSHFATEEHSKDIELLANSDS